MCFAHNLQCAGEIAAEIFACFFEFLIGQCWVNLPQALYVHQGYGISMAIRKKEWMSCPTRPQIESSHVEGPNVAAVSSLGDALDKYAER